MSNLIFDDCIWFHAISQDLQHDFVSLFREMIKFIFNIRYAYSPFDVESSNTNGCVILSIPEAFDRASL